MDNGLQIKQRWKDLLILIAYNYEHEILHNNIR